jgi:hypothetical protein
MDNKYEILQAIREAKKHLGEGSDFRIADVMETMEGIAPFLDKEVIIGLKCRTAIAMHEAHFP